MRDSVFQSWKFAADGIWEEALNIDVSDANADAVAQWVENQPQNVALEAIFSEAGHPATMFGLRVSTLCKADQVLRIRRMVSSTNAIKTENDFLKLAADNFPEFPMFQGTMDALNIGIVSQWYSFGPEVIWKPGDGKPLTSNGLKQKAGRFFDPTRNPAAIELWHTRPTDHWYKIYVSDQTPNGYVINSQKFDAAVDRLLRIKFDL